MNQKPLPLPGCTPEPLGNYLKALGVFRVVAEQADPTTRVWWEGGVLRLWSRFQSADELRDWFRDHYAPSPLIAPWSKHSGCWPKQKPKPGKKPSDKRHRPSTNLRKLVTSPSPRYQTIKAVVASFLSTFGGGKTLAESEDDLTADLKELLQQVEKDSATRSRLLRDLRNRSGDPVVVRWLDAIGTVRGQANEAAALFALLADAGTEGANSFVGNYYAYLCSHLPTAEDADGFWNSQPGRLSLCRLENALFGASEVGIRQAEAAGGLYWPGLVEAPNIGQQFIADPKKRAQPWEFLLAMEGLLLWSSAATRRTEVLPQNRVSFPFYCDSSIGGSVSLAPAEWPGLPKQDSKTNGEIWCPLWSRPATLPEIERLFSEGRLVAFEKTATRATQFVLAVASLGLERGVTTFYRVGLLERSGSGRNRSTLAIPLGSWAPHRSVDLSLIGELNTFEGNVAGLVQPNANQPRRLIHAREQLEQAIFRYAGRVGAEGQIDQPAALLDVLTAAAGMERELAATAGKVKYKDRQQLVERPIPPIQPLSPRWLRRRTPSDHCLLVDDGTREFRIALAIATLAGWGSSDLDKVPVSAIDGIRPNLLPVRRENLDWTWHDHSRTAVWSPGAPLVDNLTKVLQRRLIDADRGQGNGLPLWSQHGASFQDLLAFWRCEVDERRLAELIHALALMDSQAPSDEAVDQTQRATDPTPDPSPGAVWFDANDEPHCRWPVLRWNGRPLLGCDDDTAVEELRAAWTLPRVYPLLKLCFVGGRLPARPLEGRMAVRDGSEPYPPRCPDLLNLVLAGRLPDAQAVAVRRLRTRGYPSILLERDLRQFDLNWPADDCLRLAAMLLIPVRHGGILAALAIKPATSTE